MSLTKTITRKVVPRTARNWIRSPIRSLRWGWYDARARIGWLKSLELREGWRLRSHPAAVPFAYFAQVDDPEQRKEFDGFIARATPNMRLFDLGAHFGLFSLAAVHYGGPTAEAVAVDPSPLAIQMIAFQARVNSVRDRLQTRLAAAGAATGKTSLVAAGIESAGYFVPPTPDHPAAEQTTVPMLTVDGLAAEVGRPTHLKIDVEGAEGEVLSGAEATLSRGDAPIVFLELHNDILQSRGDDPQEVLRRLQHFGYRLLDDRDEPFEFRAAKNRAVVRLVAEPIR